MKQFLQRLWREDDGVLTIEWVLLVSVLVVGIVVGVAAARDAVVDELGDAAEAVVALDQSYVIPQPLAPFFADSVNSGTFLPSPLVVGGIGPIGGSTGSDFNDCAVVLRGNAGDNAPQGQEGEMDED